MSSIGPEAGSGKAQGTRPPDLTSSDPYAVLGLLRGATPREIKRAYFDLVRTYPPEAQPESFKRIRSAYEKLRTADAKSETDLFLFQPPEPWQPRQRKGKVNLTIDPADIWHLLRSHGDLGRSTFDEDYRAVHLSTTTR